MQFLEFYIGLYYLRFITIRSVKESKILYEKQYKRDTINGK